VRLVQIDLIDLQPAQRRFGGGPDASGRQAILPPAVKSKPTLVAMITFSRRPPCLSQRPITVSDSPPLLPGAQRE
jgi:hypothetical protein